MENVIFILVLVVMLLGMSFILRQCNKPLSWKRLKVRLVWLSCIASAYFFVCVFFWVFGLIYLWHFFVLAVVLAVLDIFGLMVIGQARRKRWDELRRTREIIRQQRGCR